MEIADAKLVYNDAFPLEDVWYRADAGLLFFPKPPQTSNTMWPSA